MCKSKMKMMLKFLLHLSFLATMACAFAPSTGSQTRLLATHLYANEEDMQRWSKATRQAAADDRVVELKRPLGLVLNEDEMTGNVYVETVAPRGNAARTGMVRAHMRWLCALVCATRKEKKKICVYDEY
jgi:hypothetical protein